MAKKILVVDDEQDILKVVTYRLKRAGYEVLSATTGKEAYDILKETSPGLIVLDYRLPDTDGIEISKKVRADERLKDVPIILLSASSASDISALVKNSEVNEYIKKPFDPEEFLEKVRKYMAINP